MAMGIGEWWDRCRRGSVELKLEGTVVVWFGLYFCSWRFSFYLIDWFGLDWLACVVRV